MATLAPAFRVGKPGPRFMPVVAGALTPSTWRIFPSTNGPTTATGFSGTIIQGTIFMLTRGGLNLDGYWIWVCAFNQDLNATNYRFCLWNQGFVDSTGTALVPNSSVTGTGTFVAGAWNFVPLSAPLQLASKMYYRAQFGMLNDFPYTNNFWTADIINGPLRAFQDDNGTTIGGGNGISWGANSTYDTSTSDPVALLTTVSPGNTGYNCWLDVQVSSGRDWGTWRCYPNYPKPAGITSVTSGWNMALTFSLTQTCSLQKIWWYSPTGAAALPTRCGIWDVTSKTIVSGTDNSSPSWKKPDGSAASAADGFVYCDYSGAGITLNPSQNYKASVYYAGGSQWRCSIDYYFGNTGGGGGG